MKDNSLTNQMLHTSVSDSNGKKKAFMLSTVDNPYSPFTQFQEWYAFDELKGYGTLSTMAYLITTSQELSENDQEEAIDDVINEMMQYDFLDHYIKVYEE
jgi:hypothetical protein